MKNPYYNGPVSDHFDGLRFFNPQGIPPGKVGDLLKWRMSNKASRWPRHWPSPFEDAKPQDRLSEKEVRVTMIGHASMLLQAGGLNILADPVFSARVSPLSFAGPLRVNPPGIDRRNLPAIDVILVSHNHYDHLDLATLRQLVDTYDPLVVTPLGNDTIIRGSCPQARIETGDWGDRVEIGGKAIIHFEPAHHWSARGMRDRRMALWAAFVIETAGGKILHVGDTGFHEGRNFTALAGKHGTVRLAILPIGAYEPRWFMQGQHMNPDEAVQAMKLCRAETAVGHHWGTFQLTDEAIEDPRLALANALEQHAIDHRFFLPLHPGEHFDA
ncbi:MAG: MBL fold metallo-hydrolase [Rhizobiaceae bacterium]